jgi:hypothetical protein
MSVDAFFSSVSLLLPFDGTDGDTSTSDESLEAHAITFNGTAQLDDAQVKYGATSLLLDGNSDYITAGSLSDWRYLHDGTEDYTVDFWFRIDAATGTTQILYDTGLATTMRGGAAYIVDSSGTLTLSAIIARGTSGTYAAQINGSTALSIGAWHFCAVVVDGSQLELFLDGSSEGTATISSPSTSAAQYTLNLGRYQQGNSAWFDGHIDDFRITRGVARYTAAFTPPVAAHPLSGTPDIGQAVETDTALSIDPVIAGLIDIAEETDTALSIDPVFDQEVAIGQAYEAQSARIITPLQASDQSVAIGIAVDTSSAFEIDSATDDTPLVYFQYEEHLSPVKKRGRAILSRALEPNERISIERKTPITQELSFSGLVDFNQLEYAFDKICFIEQEIEGSFCDCRGPVWPFEPPSTEPEESVDTRIECQPYDCEAFGDILAEVYGGDVTGLNLSFATATTADNLGEAAPIVADIGAGDGYTLEITKGSTSDASTSFRIQEVPLDVLDACEEGQYDNALRILTSTVAGQANLLLKGPVSQNYDVALVARSGRESPNNSLTSGATDAACIGKSLDVTFDYGGGSFSSSFAINQTLYVEDDTSAKTATFKVQVNGLRTGSSVGGSVLETIGTIDLDPDVAAWYNWSIIQFQVKGFTTNIVTDWINASRQRVEVVRTIAVNVAYIGDDGEPQVLSVSREFKSYSGAFSGGISNIQVENITSVPVWGFTSSVLVAGLYAKETPVDLEDLFLAYRRNLETYTPPDDCTFIGDII